MGELVSLAGVDPWELQDQLTSGRPGDIDDLAGAFHQAAGYVSEGDSIFDQARSHFRGAYRASAGVDTINDSREVQRAQQEFKLSGEQLKRISIDLEDIAGGLVDAQNAAYAPIASLNSSLDRLDVLAGTAEAGDLIDYHAIVLKAVSAVAAAGAELKSIHASYESLLDTKMTDIEANGYTPAVNLSDAADTAPIPANGTDPVKVNQWWKSLGAGERQRILSEHPDLIGNLNGIPVIDRSAANEEVMNRDIDTIDDLAKAHNVTPQDILDRPDLYGQDGYWHGYTKEQAARYGNAVQVREGIVKETKNGQHPGFLLKYEPTAFNGQGSAAIALGNPDTADNTTVILPGTGNSVQQGWLSKTNGLNTYEQASKADPNHTTAVISWMGYDAPDSLTDPRVATPDIARDSSHILASDVNGLWATHDTSTLQHVTVVGHSYGSTVVSDAAVNGMHANDVVLLGSPGTDLAHSASDFHLDNGHVFVGDVSADPVGQIGEYHGLTDQTKGGIFGQIGLGDDPAADGFGATRIKAQLPDSGLDGRFAPSSHSDYFVVGDESLHNIVTVATGHSDALAGQGMIAPLRENAGITVDTDGSILSFLHVKSHIGFPDLPDTDDPEVGRQGASSLDFDPNVPGKHY